MVYAGSDADICVLNPDAVKKISVEGHYSAMDTNAYDGWEVKGKVETTLSRGKVCPHHCIGVTGVYQNTQMRIVSHHAMYTV